MERVILWILAAGAVLGGLDLLIGNRFGLGERFEEGFKFLRTDGAFNGGHFLPCAAAFERA